KRKAHGDQKHDRADQERDKDRDLGSEKLEELRPWREEAPRHALREGSRRVEHREREEPPGVQDAEAQEPQGALGADADRLSGRRRMHELDGMDAERADAVALRLDPLIGGPRPRADSPEEQKRNEPEEDHARDAENTAG